MLDKGAWGHQCFNSKLSDGSAWAPSSHSWFPCKYLQLFKRKPIETYRNSFKYSHMEINYIQNTSAKNNQFCSQKKKKNIEWINKKNNPYILVFIHSLNQICYAVLLYLQQQIDFPFRAISFMIIVVNNWSESKNFSQVIQSSLGIEFIPVGINWFQFDAWLMSDVLWELSLVNLLWIFT